MFRVGEEIWVRDGEATSSAIAVVLDVAEESEGRRYHVFTAGVRGGLPFCQTGWLDEEALQRDACPLSVDREKIGIELLAVTGNRVDQFLIYALNEMRLLLDEAAAVAAGAGAETDAIARSRSRIEREIHVRRDGRQGISTMIKRCDLSVEVL